MRRGALAAGAAGALILAADLTVAAPATTPPCPPAARVLAAAPGVRLITAAPRAGRAPVLACARRSQVAVRVGATFGAGSPRRSVLTLAGAGGTVAAAGFEVAGGGCIYERGCASAPRQVVRIADVRRGTLRRIPLHGVLTRLHVARGGTTGFRVDEFACVSDYRTAARPGAPITLVRRTGARGSTAACAAG